MRDYFFNPALGQTIGLRLTYAMKPLSPANNARERLAPVDSNEFLVLNRQQERIVEGKG
jgi:hypothetical protein